jgi:MobA/MobL family
MALNNFDAKVLTRSKGGNAVYTAAYNAREKFTDERTGVTKNYRSKGRPEFSGFFVPQNAPLWAKELTKDRTIGSIRPR